MRTGITRAAIVAVCSAGIVACSSAPSTPPVANSGRYSIQQDRAPTRILDERSIPEVIPEPVHRTAAGNRSPYTVLGKSYTVLPTEEGYSERGIASWYGEKFHGHKTSNGEVFDMYLASAAHKSLPIPSFLRVTNLENNRSIIVRVNDRGPFHGDRLIDLSYAAAATLGYADKGTARVRVKSLVPATVTPTDRQSLLLTENSSAPPVQNEVQDEVLQEREKIERDAGEEFLQVGAFSSIESARQLLATVSGFTSLPVFIRSDEDVNTGNLLHRVRMGPVNETMDLQGLIGAIMAAGLGRPFRVRQ